MGNRTTDFNSDWIGMIMLLISEPVKIAVVQERWRRAIEDVAMDLQTTDVSKQRAGSLWCSLDSSFPQAFQLICAVASGIGLTSGYVQALCPPGVY